MGSHGNIGHTWHRFRKLPGMRYTDTGYIETRSPHNHDDAVYWCPICGKVTNLDTLRWWLGGDKAVLLIPAAAMAEEESELPF